MQFTRAKSNKVSVIQNIDIWPKKRACPYFGHNSAILAENFMVTQKNIIYRIGEITQVMMLI